MRLCHVDVLVQNFLSRVNFHYYIIYPPSFLQEYRDWWADRQANKPLGLQWTCLLLMICACSAQYTEPGLQRKIEIELGEAVEYASDRYHLVARELHSTIPVSYSHLISVQYLLHSCLWYKYEARFVESWHVLSVAIREAQELCAYIYTLSEVQCIPDPTIVLTAARLQPRETGGPDIRI